jgi:uncharacterized ubiquitin-like protein YukD
VWTENELMRLQDNFLEAREEKYITKMFEYIRLYARSTLIKRFGSYILSVRDLNYKAYLTAKEVVIQYYKRKDFRIHDSFGGYIKHKARQVVFSKKNTLSSCADYIKLEDREMPIRNGKLYIIPDIREIVTSSFKVYISFYNHEHKYWNDHKLIAKENNKREFEYFGYENYLKKIFLDHKLKTFIVFFDKEFLSTHKVKLKVGFKTRRIIEGMSLDTQVKCNTDMENDYKPITIGDHIQANDMLEKYDKYIENFDIYNVVDHIKQIVDETGKNPYCPSKKINLHRLIALRNRILFGEDKSDEFFKLFSRESKILYDKTLELIYKTLKGNI